MIQTSLDWYNLRDTMIANIRDNPYRRDIDRMIKNISNEVSELSKAEVDLRRGKRHRAAELLEKINRDIETVQEFILVARLSG